MAIQGLEFSIETKGLVRVADMLGRYATRLPRAANKDIKTIAEDYAFEMRQELNAQLLVWRGFLFGSCYVEPLERNAYAIPIPRYGHYIDKMQPHCAPLSSPVLMEWVKSGRAAIRSTGRAPPCPKGWIAVRPHPWMEVAFRRARERIDDRLERGEFHKTIERKGR